MIEMPTFRELRVCLWPSPSCHLCLTCDADGIEVFLGPVLGLRVSAAALTKNGIFRVARRRSGRAIVRQQLYWIQRGYCHVWHIGAASILILSKLSYRPGHVEMCRGIVVHSRHLEHDLRCAFIIHLLCIEFWQETSRRPCHSLSEKLLASLITFVAQIFYAHAIWKVTVNKTITYSISLLAVVCLALGIVTAVDIFTIDMVIGTRRFSIISGCVQGLAALNDALITVGMCYHLQRNRSGLPSTNQFVDSLIVYTVSRGILTATAQIIFLITNVALPKQTYFLPFQQSVGKLYVNSVLATLNLRRTFQSKSEEQYGTGPGFAFFHNGSLSVGPQRSDINAESDLPNADSPRQEKALDEVDPQKV